MPNDKIEGAINTPQNEDTDKNPISDDGESDEIKKASELNDFEKMAFGFKKRIGKITAQKKAKDAEIDALKAEIKKLKSSKSSASSIEDLDSLESAQTLLEKTKSERREMLKLLSSSEDEIEISGKLYPRSEVVSYVEKLSEAIDEKIPSRILSLKKSEALSAKKEKIEELAKQTFKELEDEDSPMSRWVRAQMEDENFEANKLMLLAYAFKGLNVSKLREKLDSMPKNVSTSDAGLDGEDEDDFTPRTPKASSRKSGRLSFDEALNLI